MKLPLWSACFLALSVAAARGDLTIVQEVEGAGPVAQMTMKIKGEKARIDATPQMSSIVDGKTGEMVSILRDQKMVMRTTAAQAKAAMSAMSAQTGQPAAAKPAGKLKVTPTGKKETISGFETEEFAVDAPGYKASYWVARSYPQGEAILKQLQAINPDSFSSGPMAAPDFRDFPGLPIRTNISMGDAKYVTRIKSVSLDPISDSEFTVPQGYKEMKMPDMSSMLGGKGATPAAPKPASSPKR